MAFNPMPGLLRETSYLGKHSPLDKAYDELELWLMFLRLTRRMASLKVTSLSSLQDERRSRLSKTLFYIAVSCSHLTG